MYTQLWISIIQLSIHNAYMNICTSIDITDWIMDFNNWKSIIYDDNYGYP